MVGVSSHRRILFKCLPGISSTSGRLLVPENVYIYKTSIQGSFQVEYDQVQQPFALNVKSILTFFAGFLNQGTMVVK